MISLALIIILLAQLTSVVSFSASYTITSITNAGLAKSDVLIVIMPDDMPSDPSLADNVIDALILINKAIYNGEVTAYMTTEDTLVEGQRVPRGSIIIIGEDLGNLESKLSKYTGIKVVEAHSPPAVHALTLNPPKIGILDVGKTYTIHSVLTEMGFEYTIVKPGEVDKLVSEGYNVFILPPGSGTYIAKLLGSDGSKKVAEFVKQGGGLIGICAGAYAVIKGYNEPTSQLQIVDATLKNWPKWALGTGIVHVNVTNPDNPVVYGFKDGFDAIYYNGPILVPYDLKDNTTLGIDAPPYIELVKYLGTSHDPGAFSYGWGELNQSYVDNVMSGGSAVVLSCYGAGKIVLFSIHPELTSGDLGYAPNAKLPSKYNWRLLFNAIYYVSSANKVTLVGMIKGTWMWPSTFRSIYDYLLENYPGLDKNKALEVAAELLSMELASYGITDVFIEVKSTRGYAFYPSNVLPTYPLEPYNETNIYIPLIKKLHEYSIRVHAWIPFFYDSEVWGKKDPVWHVGKSASNWKPFPRYKYVRPANTTYVSVLADLVKELLDMGFDGIHLDYIRYGHMVYSFSPADIKRAEEAGINVSKVIDAIRRTFYEDYPGGYDPTYIWRLYMKHDKDIVKWFELRRNDIKNAITLIAETAREHKTVYGTEPILSAALMSDIAINRTIPGYNFTIPGYLFQLLHYGQMYDDFAEQGYWLIPMAYYLAYGQPVSWVKNITSYASSVAEAHGTIALTGIQAWSVGLEDVEKEKEYALEGGAYGIVYFRWKTYEIIVRENTWDTYSQVYSELLDTILDVMRAGKLMNALDDKELDQLIKYYMLVDTTKAGMLYPEPSSTISIIKDYLNSLLDKILLTTKEKLNTLKTTCGNTQALSQIELLLARASTSDCTYKAKLLVTTIEIINTLSLTTTLTQQSSTINAEINEIQNNITTLEDNVKNVEKHVDDLSNNVSNTLYLAIAALAIAIISIVLLFITSLILKKK